jgi:hypothetical protein
MLGLNRGDMPTTGTRDGAARSRTAVTVPYNCMEGSAAVNHGALIVLLIGMEGVEGKRSSHKAISGEQRVAINSNPGAAAGRSRMIRLIR